nr:ATP-binding cassette domain-containing protein [Candidatus Thiosymbion oneisti]
MHIEDISFSIGNESCAVALVGESGMGKTTIFKSLFPRFINDWSIEPGFRFSAKHSFNNTSYTDREIQRNIMPTTIGFASQLPFFLEEHTASDNIFSSKLDETRPLLNRRKKCLFGKVGIGRLRRKTLVNIIWRAAAVS